MKLLKNLSFTYIFRIATGAMISSGIFLLETRKRFNQ